MKDYLWEDESLFSGAGGDTLGLQQAGIKIKAYVELDKTFPLQNLKELGIKIESSDC